MPRSVQIYFPPEDFEFYRQALTLLAGSLISDQEAGQRKAKVSIFVRLILVAYIRDAYATVAALEQVKKIALGQ